MWLVFDSAKPIDLEPIRSKGGSMIGDVSALPLDKGQAIRIRLNRPQMPSLTGDDQAGAELDADLCRHDADADAAAGRDPQHHRSRARQCHRAARDTRPAASAGRSRRRRRADGDHRAAAGRGFIKRQDFVEFSLLESIHGVVVQPNSDDVTAEVASDKITLSRPGGLTLSSADVGAERAAAAVRPIFDVNEWRSNQQDDFFTRLDALVTAAASAEAEQRTPARLDLARFYMARGMYPEAKGVLDLTLGDAKPGQEDPPR